MRYLLLVLWLYSCSSFQTEEGNAPALGIAGHKESDSLSVKVKTYYGYDSVGALTAFSELVFDEKDQLIEERTLDGFLDGQWMVRYKYDCFGAEIAKTNYSVQGLIISAYSSKKKHTYDQKKRKTSTCYEGGDSSGVVLHNFSYSKKGELVAKTEHHGKKWVTVDSFLYLNGRLLEHMTKHLTNGVRNTSKYQYNDNGQLDTLFNCNLEKGCRVEEVYRYNTAGQLLEWKRFCDDLCRRKTMRYHSSGVTKDSTVDYFYGEGRHDIERFDYDEQGRLIEFLRTGRYASHYWVSYVDSLEFQKKNYYRAEGYSYSLYDSLGFPLVRRRFDSTGRLVSHKVLDYRLDAKGNPITVTKRENGVVRWKTNRRQERRRWTHRMDCEDVQFPLTNQHQID